MRRAVISFGLWFVVATTAASEPFGFVQVTDHCYYLAANEERGNIGAIVTDEGVVVVDPQRVHDGYRLTRALRAITPKPVRWIVRTHEHADQLDHFDPFSRRDVTQIWSRENPRPGQGTDEGETSGQTEPLKGRSYYTFKEQMHLFPSGLEVQILRLGYRAHTGSDIVVFVPSEKVLITGDLYAPGRYPDIPEADNGSAIGWLEGVSQVIDSIPLLKAAIPEPEPDPSEIEQEQQDREKTGSSDEAELEEQEEKTLEELVFVVPGHGEMSNLKEVKELWRAARRLRSAAKRAITGGRSREQFVKHPSLTTVRNYENFRPFAELIYDELKRN